MTINGGADLYSADAEYLRREGAISLKVFMDSCQKYGVEAFKAYHTLATSQPMGLGLASGKSLNQLNLPCLNMEFEKTI